MCTSHFASSDAPTRPACSRAGEDLHPFEKKVLPWIEIASRVTVIALGIWLSPQLFFTSFAVGAVVGYNWPNAKKVDINNSPFGCSQSQLEWLADGKQPVSVVLIISTLFFTHHMEHAKGLYVPVAGYMVGQSAARAFCIIRGRGWSI